MLVLLAFDLPISQHLRDRELGHAHKAVALLEVVVMVMGMGKMMVVDGA